jgi:ribosomal protein L22
MQISSKLSDARISFKSSLILSRELKGKRVGSAKQFLDGLINQTTNIDGKHYTTVAKTFLQLLKSAEANARQKNLDTEKLFVKIAKTDKARKFVRPKSRFKFRGREAKTANIEIVLEER